MPSSFWLYSKKELNEVNVRQVNGQKGEYKVSSLENIRHGLNRYLRSPPQEKDYDIIQDKEFREANFGYRAALKDLKTEGKGAVDHHPVISDSDLGKIRESIYLKTNTPHGLFNKVQFVLFHALFNSQVLHGFIACMVKYSLYSRLHN